MTLYSPSTDSGGCLTSAMISESAYLHGKTMSGSFECCGMLLKSFTGIDVTQWMGPVGLAVRKRSNLDLPTYLLAQDGV